MIDRIQGAPRGLLRRSSGLESLTRGLRYRSAWWLQFNYRGFFEPESTFEGIYVTWRSSPASHCERSWWGEVIAPYYHPSITQLFCESQYPTLDYSMWYGLCPKVLVALDHINIEVKHWRASMVGSASV